MGSRLEGQGGTTTHGLSLGSPTGRRQQCRRAPSELQSALRWDVAEKESFLECEPLEAQSRRRNKAERARGGRGAWREEWQDVGTCRQPLELEVEVAKCAMPHASVGISRWRPASPSVRAERAHFRTRRPSSGVWMRERWQASRNACSRWVDERTRAARSMPCLKSR